MNTAENSTTDPSTAEVSEQDAVVDAVEPKTAPTATGDTGAHGTVTVPEEAPVAPIADIETADAVEPADGTASAHVETDAPVEIAAAEPVAAEPETPKPAPVADEVLLAAAAVARGALLKITPASTIGEPAGHIVEDDHVLSLLFAATLPGYPGWNWTVTLARVEDGEPMILETELMPGERALLAPEWVPWSERLADYRASQEAAEAESRALAEAAAELEDDEDEDEGFSILHAGDLDGVDVDEIDDSSDDDDGESDDDDDESDDDDDDDDEFDDDDDGDDDDDESDDDESERSY